MDSYQILINQLTTLDQRNQSDCIEKLLINIVKSFAKEVQANYAKYFINNCLIVNGSEPFTAYSKPSKEVRKIVNEFINENVEVKSVEKTKCELYTDSFDFRPFFGPGLAKLPTCDRSGGLSGDVAKWNWDELYINPGFDGERFESGHVKPVSQTIETQTETIEEPVNS